MSKAQVRRQQAQARLQAQHDREAVKHKLDNYHQETQVDPALVHTIKRQRDREWAQLDARQAKLQARREALRRQWQASGERETAGTPLDAAVRVLERDLHAYELAVAQQEAREDQFQQWVNSLADKLEQEQRQREFEQSVREYVSHSLGVDLFASRKRVRKAAYRKRRKLQ